MRVWVEERMTVGDGNRHGFPPLPLRGARQGTGESLTSSPRANLAFHFLPPREPAAESLRPCGASSGTSAGGIASAASMFKPLGEA